ncbi:MAG TPA: hypothetical protein PK537_12750, partial [Candidatus Limiplasma sp.]|nr:hypothetical protein [Candidatus Limiplasma sp.]
MNRKTGTRLRFSDAEQAENFESTPVQMNRRKGKPPKAPPDEHFQNEVPKMASDADSPPTTRSRLHFADDETVNPALQKAKAKADIAAAKLTKAKARIPKKKAMSIARATDKATGKTKTRLRFEEKAKGAPSMHTPVVTRLPVSELHHQISKAEEENTDVEAAHHSAETAEGMGRFAAHSYRAQKLRPYRQLEAAERRLDKANLRVLQKQEPLSSNPFSRWRQKQAIKKAYTASKTAGGMTQRTVRQNLRQRAVHGIKRMFVRNKKTYILGGALFLVMAMVMNGLSSCTPLVQGGLQALVIATYPAEDTDILAAERYYKGLEDELQSQIDRYAADHPQYDEFLYEIDDIWHDPHALISLVSAHANDEWTIDDV